MFKFLPFDSIRAHISLLLGKPFAIAPLKECDNPTYLRVYWVKWKTLWTFVI